MITHVDYLKAIHSTAFFLCLWFYYGEKIQLNALTAELFRYAQNDGDESKLIFRVLF